MKYKFSGFNIPGFVKFPLHFSGSPYPAKLKGHPLNIIMCILTQHLFICHVTKINMHLSTLLLTIPTKHQSKKHEQSQIHNDIPLHTDGSRP